MTDPTSPPAFPPNGAPLGDDSGPISPVSGGSVSRSSTFAHKTSPAVSTQTRLIDTATPAINSVPVELDGVATSSEDLVRRGTGESGGGRGSEGSKGRRGGGGVLSPADEEDIDGEFLGGAGRAGRDAREKRAAMLASRSKDPSVIVDIPQDPTAEEVEAAKSAEGMVTPSLNAEGGVARGLGAAR